METTSNSALLSLSFGKIVRLVTCLALLFASSLSFSEEEPRLIIDSQGPSGQGKELIFTPDGSSLISLGDDKAIRFWDVATGELRKTLRLSIGDGIQGQLHAGAISPNGRWLAVGGLGIQDAPYLVNLIDIDSGEMVAIMRGHTYEVYSLAFSDDSRVLASGSGDATVRVWDLSGIAQGSGGNALEIEDSQILRGHLAPVHAVDFSVDGTRLVSASYDHKLILWDRDDQGNFGKAETMEGHRAETRSAGFSPDGHFVVSGGFDQRVLLWDGESGAFLKELEGDMEAQVHTVHYSPDGSRVLASSQTADSGFTAVYEVKSGRRIIRFDRHTNTVGSSAWHPTEDLVATAGGHDKDIFLWNPGSGEVIHHIRGEGRTVWAVAYSDDGGAKVAFGQETPASGILFDAPLRRTFDFTTFALSDLPESRADPPGYRRMNHEKSGKVLQQQDSYLLQTGSGTIRNDQSYSGFIRSYSFTPSSDVAVGSDFSFLLHRPTGEPFRQFIGHEGVVWAVSPSPDGRFLASASDDQTVRLWSLQEPAPLRVAIVGAGLQDANDGIVIGSVANGFPAAAAGIRPGDVLQSIDSNKFTKAQDAINYTLTKEVGDQVVYRIARGGEVLEIGMILQEYLAPQAAVKPLASLFVGRDGEWVCWTPSGHYHASAGGEQYIGWQINKGVDKVAEFFPAAVFREQFHDPELVKRTVELGDFDKALAEVAAKAAPDLAEVLPPQVEWILPATASGSSAVREVTVKATISSPKSELEEIKLLVNGKAVVSDFRASGNSLAYEENVTLLPGENRLAIFARNRNTGHTSAERIVTVGDNSPTSPAADDLDDLLKPNLYVLAVGVSTYEDESIPSLEYCDDDAAGIAEFFENQNSGIFGGIEVRLLSNEKATEGDIQDGLDWLEKSATQKDFVVLFLAAHGLNDDKGNFYLLPHDADPERLRSTGVAWDDFGDILGNLPSRVLMFLDTCHSGRLGANLFTLANVDGARTRSLGGLKSAFDPTEAIRELTSEENGVVIMAASTGDEESLEHADWGHGAFTRGLLDGLGGKADVNGDGIIHLRELDFYVSDRVKELTDGVQHPTTVKPSTISRLPVAKVR